MVEWMVENLDCCMVEERVEERVNKKDEMLVVEMVT